MDFCPCGTTTGRGETCSGSDDSGWCKHCRKIAELDLALAGAQDALSEHAPLYTELWFGESDDSPGDELEAVLESLDWVVGELTSEHDPGDPSVGLQGYFHWSIEFKPEVMELLVLGAKAKTGGGGATD